MKVFSLTCGALLALACINPAWAADPGNAGEPEATVTETQAAPDSSAVSTAQETGETETSEQGTADSRRLSTSVKVVKFPAHYEDGRPMTHEEFNQAYQARMKARTKAVENRLEARQSRWNKDKTEAATDGSDQ